MMKTRLTLACAVTALACLASACAFMPSGSTTNITVQYTSETLLHMAHLPTTTPDGEPTGELKRELMESLSGRGAAVTLMPARGAVMRETDDGPALRPESVEVLMAEGPPEMGLVIWRFLREEYDLPQPWVVSLPQQPLARVSAPEAPAAHEGGQ